ncbi:MAG: cytochrome c [Magnetovibrio sp.]|nr:cytochrome c [Magnetovibrio sp.]
MRQLITALLTLSVLSAPALAADTAKDNYNAYCVQCHGMQGNGMGLNVRDMSVQPRDHTDAKAMSGRTDDELFKVIKEGGLSISKSVLMPAWNDVFSDQEITNLVVHLRELCQCKYGK